MKRFVSLPIKILLVTISALLVTSLLFTSMSLLRLDDEFKTYQRDKLRSGNEQFHQQKQILTSQMQLWMESFSDVIKLNQQDDFSALAQALSEQYDYLQIRMYIENIWLVDEHRATLYATTEIPSFVQNSIKLSIEFQEPQSRIYCIEKCVQLVTIPVLNKQSELAVVVMTASLVEMRAALKQSLNSDVAILKVNVNDDSTISSLGSLGASNHLEMQRVFKEFPKQVSLIDTLQNGVEVLSENQSYLVNFVPLSEGQDAYYLGLISDISEYIDTNNDYKIQVVVVGGVLFVLLAALVLFITYGSSKRLLHLADILPLLAEKKFHQFKLYQYNKRSYFPDELDILSNSVEHLGAELEQLNYQVEQKTQELENIAMYDLLTGLPNRNMLNYQIKKTLASLSLSDSGIAVLFLDLDDFKKVNDSHGHAEGDKLLIEAAKRLRLCTRKNDVACRFGGDEFVIVLTYLDSIDEATKVAENILEQFRLPIDIGSSRFYVSTSIGISLTKNENAVVEDLVRQADLAMYEAKDDGGGCYHIYNLDMYQRVARRVMLESEVREALRLRQFSLSLQPQINIENNQLYGFEALLRWTHPERGMVSPDDFIPILENSQHMIELGYWVIRHCFELMAEFKSMGHADLKIAINLSAGQFSDNSLVDFLKTQLNDFSLPARNFELEITEHTLVKDIDRTLETMDELKKLGFSFAIDDFGTGYSSLGYLKRMPVDIIKIDKSFIFGMLENQSDYQIIMSTIAMVQNLGLQIIAEGVETSAQLHELKKNKCNLVQGYYYSKPVPEVDVFKFIGEKFKHGKWIAA